MKTKIHEIALVVAKQHVGRVNNWAGMWSDCAKCRAAFAYSWNWSDDAENSPPENCPLCRLVTAVEENEK